MKKLITALMAMLAGTSAAFADGLTPQPTSAGSSLPSLLMLVVFVLVFYFLLIRPQMKRSKEQRQLISALTKGDEVVTVSGVYGRIVELEDTSVEVEIAENVVVKMQKQSVVSLLPKGTVKFGVAGPVTAVKESKTEPAVLIHKRKPGRPAGTTKAKTKTSKKNEA